MKSPFLVAAQMKASSLEKMQQEMDASEEASSASSSSLSSSTSSLNGYSTSSTPSKSLSTPSSSKKSKKQKLKQQLQHHQEQQNIKSKSNSINGQSSLNMPDLDALPGSLLQVNEATSLTRSSTEDSHNATMNGSPPPVKTRSRANTRALREAERHRKAKRRSTAILGESSLFFAGSLFE